MNDNVAQEKMKQPAPPLHAMVGRCSRRSKESGAKDGNGGRFNPEGAGANDERQRCGAMQKQGNAARERKVEVGVIGFLPGGNDCAVDIFDLTCAARCDQGLATVSGFPLFPSAAMSGQSAVSR